MFGSIGGPEILLIFVLALLFFGPRKLPEIGRALGKTVAEFRKATAEFRSTLEREVEMEKLKETGTALRSARLEAADAVTGPGLLGEVTAALRPAGVPEPHAGGQDAARGAEVPQSREALPPAPPVGPPAAAPVPFADDGGDVPPPGAPSAPAPSVHDAKRDQD